MASNFPPRPRNTLGFSLGAVGGPRGTGAGATRVLVQFLTQYDKGQLEQLSKDLQTLKQQQARASTELAQAGTRQKAIEEEITRAKQARLNLDAQSQKALKAVLDIQTRARAEEEKSGRVSQQTTATLLQREKTFRSINGLSAQQSAAVLNQFTNQQALRGAVVQTNAARQRALAVEQQINATMQQGAAIAAVRMQAFAQIRGLVLGAIGGVVGGAIVGAVFYKPLQDMVDSLQKGLEQMVNPAKAAGEALGDVASAIKEIADRDNVSGLEAATQLLERMGASAETVRRLAPQLAEAQELKLLQENVELRQKLTEFLLGEAELRGRLATQTARQNAALDRQAGTLQSLGIVERFSAEQMAALAVQNDDFQRFLDGAVPGLSFFRVALNDVDWMGYIAGAAEAGDVTADTAEELRQAADAAADMRQELAQEAIGAALDTTVTRLRTLLDNTLGAIRDVAEADINAIRDSADAATQHIRDSADARIDALQKRMRGLEVQPSRRTQNLEGALKGLSDAGPSQRTNALAVAIERLGDAESKAAFQAQLAQIAEKKRQILLAERLRNTRTEIDLSRYQGKDRILAIDALLERMRKQNEAQDRFNKLLDIQYQISKGVRRQQGETIREFISRRAQYYRGLLQQAAELQREGPQAELEAEKERVQTSISLRELEQQRKKLIEDRARDQYLKSLQEQLRASQERDRKELQHRRDMLQEQLSASKKADQAALDARRQALQDQIDAVRKSAQREVEIINQRRDDEIEARRQARDKAVQLAQETATRAIEAEQKRAELLKKWADYGETERMIQAYKGATSVAELQAFSGSLSGATYALNYLKQTGQWMGLDPITQQILTSNLTRAMSAYTQKLSSFYQGPAAQPSVPAYRPGGYQEGGAFTLRNSQQHPFGQNIRHGEDGLDEIGLILNNKILRQLKGGQSDSSRALVSGDMIIQTPEDPYRARANWRHEVRALVREELTR